MIDRRSVCVLATIIVLSVSLWYASANYDDEGALHHRQVDVRRPSPSTDSRTAAPSSQDADPDDVAAAADSLPAKPSTSSSSSTAAAGLSWDAERSAFSKQAADRDELKFTPETLRTMPSALPVAAASSPSPSPSSVADALRARGCDPTRFLFVNTHTWGRHHNQLQEMLHTIAFARRFQRTAVLGFFRAKKRWWDPSELYDVSALLATECLVTFDDFRALWAALPASAQASAVCFGQGTRATPFQKVVRRCTMAKDVPAHYKVKTGFQTTRELFFDMILQKALPTSSSSSANVAHFIGISGEIAFFLRPGIVATAKLLSRIRPAKAVAAELQAFLASKQLAVNDRMSRLWFGGVEDKDAAKNNNAYFALHLRQRERDCLKEVDEALEINPAMAARLSEPQRKAVRTQCAIPVAHVNEQLFDRYGVPRVGTKMFLASDHENMPLEDALVARGAVMYKGKFDHSTLQGLAVDFFALAAGANFSGNQLSSVSQNACFLRLGLGLSCHGFVADYALHLSAPLAPLS